MFKWYVVLYCTCMLAYTCVQRSTISVLLYLFIPALRNFNGAPIVTANVGVSSFLRDSRKLLLAEAKLVTAHEIGEQ